jgi:DNA invertase Pin-like site-specific DNA recombinase
VILALEVSRLASSSADWHRLLDLCAPTGTLIADADGIYSPAQFNDRLLLGLKGTMSEAELHIIRSRLRGGLENKARRGELRLSLPVGLDRDEDGQIRLSSDEQPPSGGCVPTASRSAGAAARPAKGQRCCGASCVAGSVGAR